MPRLKLKLPSRNWFIFLSITGSFTTALLYDRQQKKKAQQRWCNLVSHMANEPVPTNIMPRRITIFLSAPPGDGLRVAREHFHEYIKPILVAGALDWEVIEGRREGEVRAGLAEKIRKARQRNDDAPQLEIATGSKHDGQDLVEELRRKGGIKEWNGLQGDLVLGRHTWKEYIRGLHEGWLGPLDPPPTPDNVSSSTRPEGHRGSQEPDFTSETVSADSISGSQDLIQPQETTPDPPVPPPPPPAKKTSLIPAYISSSAYHTRSLPSSIPPNLPPSLPLPFPHLLGFLNTPTRLYRFLTQRKLAEETGALVAGMVLGSNVRSFRSSTTPLSATANTEGSEFSSSANASDEHTEPTQQKRIWWEQENVLSAEQSDWHKSVWKDEKDQSSGEAEEKKVEREHVWRGEVVVDDRIGARMLLFELAPHEAERAVREEAERKANADPWWKGVKEYILGPDDKRVKGWEMGEIGGEHD